MANIVDDYTVDRSYLTKGSTGDGVSNLQHSLSSLGYNTGPTDGVFGPTTESAVKQLQKESNITVDGQVGSETRGVLDQLINQMNQTRDQIKQQTTPQSVSAPAYTVPAATTGKGMTNDQLSQLLTSLLNNSNSPAPTYTPPPSSLPSWVTNMQPFQAPQTHVLTMDEALSRALGVLNPQYESAQRQLENNLKLDQESRGLFFSPVGAQLSSDKVADLKMNQQSELNKYAQNLISDSEDQANQQLQNALAAWNANSGLANTLINQDNANRTSAFNQWLEQQQLGSNNKSSNIDNITKVLGSMTNISEDQRAAVTEALKRAEMFGKVVNETDAKILGVPVGTDTLTAKSTNSAIATDLAQRSSIEVDAAMKRAEITGTVNNEADAKILGVPVGTTLQSAKVINAELDSRQIANETARIDAALKRADTLGVVATQEDADLLGVKVGTSTLEAKQVAAQIKSIQIGDAINRANLTGTITNADDAKLLGVKVGTSTLEARKFYLQQEATKIESAMKRVDTMGYVDKQSAAALGIPVGTPTLAARQMSQQMSIAKMEDATRRAANASSNSGNNAQKINQLMDVWKVTGYAPSGLESLGVKAGTPYSPTDVSKPSSKDINGIQKMFGVDSNTAEDIFIVQQSPTRESAIAELEAAVRAASTSGQTIDKEGIMKAINYKWPTTTKNTDSTNSGGGTGGGGGGGF